MTEPIIWLRGRAWRANSYVIGNILVDAGLPVSDIQPYRDQIDTIVLTHGHYDHTANIREIADLTGAGVFIGESDAPFLSDDALCRASAFGARPPGGPADPLKDHVGEFRVLRTPGHTHGSVCLFREEDGALIAGDTLFPHGSFGRTDLPTGDHQELVASVDRLAELSVRSLWCGHETPVPSDAMHDVLLSKAEVRRYG
jgi:glyoxylase-like metal-dependent hydrolase (beta-lactamase superfamily II)